MGPGLGYYGGGGLSLILALILIYLVFGRGRAEALAECWTHHAGRSVALGKLCC